jgi:hypothetical protein
MPFIHPLSSPKDKQHKKEIRRCASVATKVLTDEYSVDELKDELKLANRLLSKDEKVVQPKDAQKADYVSCVKSARQRVIQKDSSWVDTVQGKAEKEYDEWKKSKLESLEKDMKEECSRNFIRYESTVREKFSTDDHKYDVVFNRTEGSQEEELPNSQETRTTTSEMGSFF